MSEKKINAMLDKINAELDAKPAKRPSRKKCTGCGVRFSDEGDEDGEYFVDDECPDCGTCGCIKLKVQCIRKKMQGTWLASRA